MWWTGTATRSRRLAAAIGEVRIMRWLLAAGANAAAVNGKGGTVIALAPKSSRRRP
jgi:hypothetical protein